MDDDLCSVGIEIMVPYLPGGPEMEIPADLNAHSEIS